VIFDHPYNDAPMVVKAFSVREFGWI